MKKVFFVLFFLQVMAAGFAQLNYILTNAQNIAGVYTDLGATGTAITTNFTGGAMTFDDDNSSIQNIGFTFTYNGTSFTQFVLNTNGFIKLGVLAPASTNYNVLSSQDSNALAAFNYDLDAGTATPEYRVLTSGFAGSRICTIQFKNLREWPALKQYNNINFQIKLFETSNNIEFVYGSFTPSAVAPSVIQPVTVIKGSHILSYLDVVKSGSTAWSSATFEYSSTPINYLKNRNNVLPTSGRTFRFSTAPPNNGQLGINTGTPWTFINGDTSVPQQLPVYGTQTLPGSGNKPGAKEHSVSWTDASGNQWLFGGYGTTSTSTGYLNDLWKHDTTTDQWTFVKGDNIPNVPGVYGIRGVAAASNNPGAREWGVSWVDAAGILWLFGGVGYNTSIYGWLNDLWKYNPATNMWTWVKGDNSGKVPGIYGTKGVPADNNNPGSRWGSVSWIDGSGNFWLFGGFGFYSLNNGAYLNDLWKYNPVTNQWTWMTGDTTANVLGVYGSLGVTAPTNKPGARTGTVSWNDETGNLWLFGGNGYHASSSGWLNDLWKYNISTNQWTWIKGDSTGGVFGNYGIKGTAAAANKPGARESSVAWKDVAGDYWLLGGSGYAAASTGYLNDLWKYNIASNQWTWINGDNTSNVLGVYGTQGVAAAANKPGGRSTTVNWKDGSGNIWIFGGRGYPASGGLGYLNDLWKYNPGTNQWMWVNGNNTIDEAPIYGLKGFISEGNSPGARDGSVSWKDASGNFWLFGGDGDTSSALNGYFNDLWKYNPSTKQWIWMKGDNTKNVNGVYGTLGVVAAANKPGSRVDAVTWTDGTGNLWLLGGYGYFASSWGWLNDLWKYDPATNNWTWVKGDSTGQVNGFYGTQGIAAAANKPGSRYSSVSWTDSSGNLWLFGGYGYDAVGTVGFLNDLWKYNIGTNQWMWVKGDNTSNVIGIYGTQGIAAAGNKPGSRHYSLPWADGSGNLWLYGGYGYNNASVDFLNDLWKYNIATNQWTWMKGDNSGVSYGVFGTKGIAASANKPGAMYTNTSWIDGSGNLWLFGGYGYAESTGGILDDLWKYTPVTNNWTWIKGDKTANSLGIFGIKGTAAAANNPGGTRGSVSWTNASGDNFIYAGYGSTANGDNILNMFWKYSPATNQWTWVTGEPASSNQGVYNVKGIPDPANKPGARSQAVSWTYTSKKLWLFGGADFSEYLNDLWKYDPATDQWAWMKGDSVKNVFTGVYGTQGVAAATNKPGARKSAVSWTDSLGQLWLFGGTFIESGIQKRLNDLWKYDTLINHWAWMKGNNTVNSLGIYGSVGVSAAANNPGSRDSCITWKDAFGNLWLFGGSGYAASGAAGKLNDLWKYNPVTNQWTWMKGDNTINNAGIYGVLGTGASTNKPGARSGSISWIDTSGKLWLFGGSGFDITGTSGRLNDLWKYDPVTNQWIWMKGDNTVNAMGVFGTQGTVATTNKPGASEGAVSWRDFYGRFWMFGGYGNSSSTTGNLNDLWKFDPITNQWTWISGDNSVNTRSASNKPGGRTNSISWIDGYGTFWLFGGYGMGTSGSGYLNDLWKIFGGTKYIFTGSGNWSTAGNWQNNLVPPTTITPGMDVTIDHQIPGVSINTGSIVLQTFGSLTVQSGKLLTIDQGSLSNAGSVIGPGNIPGRIEFTGTNTDSLNSSGSITTPLLLTNKKMFLTGNTNTSLINLLGNTAGRSATTGISTIILGNFNLNMDTATLIGDNANFIITNGTGSLKRNVGNTPVLFPIGIDSNSYTPVTITNNGVNDNFFVRVKSGVYTNGNGGPPVTTGNVDRTWQIQKDIPGTGNGNIIMQWNTSDEQTGFLRGESYISHFQVCPPPENCDNAFWDFVQATPASGTNPVFTQLRNNVTSFNTPSFIVTSRPAVYTFINTTGNGNWNNPLNWTNEKVAPSVILSGMEVVINPTTGQCDFTGILNLMPGGKITVMPGKIFNVRIN